MTGNITFSSGATTLTSGGLTAGKIIGIKQFTSGTAATYTPTTGTKMIYFELVGAGGGGGRTAVSSGGGPLMTISGPGGSGATIRALISASSLSATYTIGVGGAVGASAGATGSSGGSSNIIIDGLTWTSGGGGGGGVASSGSGAITAVGGVAGSASLPVLNANVLYSESSSGVQAPYNYAVYATGLGLYGSSLPDGANSSSNFQTKSSSVPSQNNYLVGPGASNTFTATSNAGLNPGGGGGCAASAQSGSISSAQGSGRDGKLTIIEYA
jgi:hypothetical protein